MYNIILFVLFLLVSFNAGLKAQPFVDVVNVQYTLYNSAPMKKDLNAKVEHQSWSGSIFLPLPLKNKDRFIIGADNISYTIRYSGIDTSIPSSLYSTSIQIGWLKNLKNDRWTTLFLLIPRQAADFQHMYFHDLQLGGAVVYTYAWKKDLKLKFGLYYNREFFGNYFMPLAGLDWKVDDHLNIWGLLPGGLNIMYSFNKAVSCGIKYQSITASYRSQGSNDKVYIREGETFWSDQQISLHGDIYVIKNLVLYAGFGMTGFHYFQEYNRHHDMLKNMPEFQQSRDRGFLYGGLAFRVSTE
jgi:hypothetical protein